MPAVEFVGLAHLLLRARQHSFDVYVLTYSASRRVARAKMPHAVDRLDRIQLGLSRAERWLLREIRRRWVKDKVRASILRTWMLQHMLTISM